MRGRRARILGAIGTAVVLLPLQTHAVPAVQAAAPSATMAAATADDNAPLDNLSDGSSAVRAGELDVVDGRPHVRREDDTAPAPVSAGETAPSRGTGRYIVRVARGRSAGAVAAELRADGVDAEVLTRTAFQMIIVDPEPGDLSIVDDNPGVAQIWEDMTVSVDTDQANPPWGLDRIDQGSLPLDNKFSYDNDGTGVTAYI
ncbi:MAG: hypothetical protein ACKOFT_04575, partial [Actinomycetota bacterium]